MAKFKYKFKTGNAQIDKVHSEYLARVSDAIVNRLSYVGERFVKNARSKTSKEGGFNDITGNLRSSIGYVIIDNGVIVEENFEARTPEGANEGKKLTQKIAAEFQSGFALVVVAGMNYAAAVENLNHKDVITGSSLIAEKELKEGFAKLEKKLNL